MPDLFDIELLESAAAETVDLRPDATPLAEAAVGLAEGALRRDGTMRVRVINPGWGTSGFYSEALLRRDGPQVIRAGTHAYLDHPSYSEEADRPERSLRDLAGVYTTDAVWEAAGPMGPGLYADVRPFAGYGELLEEMADAIGVSIRGSGEGHMGEAEGREGRIIDRLTSVESVDFVTHPGRGGRIVQLLESARTASAAAREALSAEDTRARLRSQLADRFSDHRYVWVRDWTDSTVIFELEASDDADLSSGTYQLGYTSDGDDVTLADGDPVEVIAQTTYVPVGEAGRPDPRPAPVAVTEARNVGQWFESRIHLGFTQIADDAFGSGRLTREERIALSSAIGDALDAFTGALEAAAPQLYQRDLYEDPGQSATTREGATVPPTDEQLAEANRLRDEAAAQLTEATTRATAAEERAARAESGLLVLQAERVVEAALAADDAPVLPQVVRTRLAERLAQNPPVTADGALDRDTLRARIYQGAIEEAAYIAELRGEGHVRGLGLTEAEDTTVEPEKAAEVLEGALGRLGLSDEVAKRAAAGR